MTIVNLLVKFHGIIIMMNSEITIIRAFLDKWLLFIEQYVYLLKNNPI